MTKEYKEYKAEVLRIIDGDTIEVRIDLGFGIKYKNTLRLLDFDAPETYRPKTAKERKAGKKVTAYLKDRINAVDNKITLRTYRRVYGKYGRILSKIFIHEEDIIQTMINLEMEKHKKYV